MKDFTRTLRPAVVSLLAFTLMCGLLYPLAVGGIAALAFPEQAHGSLVRDATGRVIGSELIGQPFDHSAYLWGRPSATTYAAMTSSGTNQGTTGFVDDRGTIGANPALFANARARIDELRRADPGNTATVPVELVTASASGLDPHLSPAAARYQIPRIARARKRGAAEITAVIDEHAEERTLGVLGEPRINVFAVNRALDARFGRPR